MSELLEIEKVTKAKELKNLLIKLKTQVDQDLKPPSEHFPKGPISRSSKVDQTELEIEKTVNELELYIRILKVERIVDQSSSLKVSSSSSKDMKEVMNEISSINQEIKRKITSAMKK